MDNSDKDRRVGAKLKIGFPKSKEDHRLQLVEINDSIFAIVHAPLESLGPIFLNCEPWSLVLLAPIKSEKNIVISAINVICLNEIRSVEGTVDIHATNRMVKFAHLNQSGEKLTERGERGEFKFGDDPAAFLYYYRLFEAIVASVREGSLDSISDAQQKFIVGLCALADKIEGKSDGLNIKKVLDFWAVPDLKA